MKIAIVGTGYVGLVTGVSFANMGNDVTCVDTNTQKIEMLQSGKMPIYEPGLEEMALKNIKEGRLHFTADLASCIDEVNVVFCAVGTPPDEDGSADLKYVLAVARQFGQLIKKYTLIVTKSTVPVGTAEKVRHAVQTALAERGENIPFDVASNPEFLKEGSALKDVMYPDRIVVGVDSDDAKNVMEELYRPFNLIENKIIFTDIPSAEMIKYAANSMLATRISFMNDIANLCEKVGANVDDVRRGIGSDTRIGKKFLYPGCGYGGSCFPKDVKALIKTAEQNGYDMKVLKAVEEVNEAQKHILYKKLYTATQRLKTQPDIFTLWGLAFKPETDDMREATAIVLINELLSRSPRTIVKVYDPIAMEECKRRFENHPYKDRIIYCDNKYDALKSSDVLFLVTEWNDFRMVEWGEVKKLMRQPIVIDGRNLYSRFELEAAGFYYDGIGK